MPIRYILPKNNAIKHLSDGDIVVEISGGSPTQSTGRCTAITQSLLIAMIVAWFAQISVKL